MRSLAKTFIILLSLLLLMVLTGCKSSVGGSPATVVDETSNTSNTGNTIGTITWDAPIKNTDGSLISGLEGYKIYYGTSSSFYTAVLDVGNVTSYAIGNLASGTYYVAVTAYDSSGNESDFSNEVSKTIP